MMRFATFAGKLKGLLFSLLFALLVLNCSPQKVELPGSGQSGLATSEGLDHKR